MKWSLFGLFWVSDINSLRDSVLNHNSYQSERVQQGPMFHNQFLDNFVVPLSGGQMERSHAMLVANIDESIGLEQNFHHLLVAQFSGNVQCCLASL